MPRASRSSNSPAHLTSVLEEVLAASRFVHAQIWLVDSDNDLVFRGEHCTKASFSDLVCWARYLVRPVKATRAWSHSATALRRLLHTPVFCAIWLTDGPRSSGKSHKKARGQSVIKVPRARARKHTHTKTDRFSSIC